jgi:hypothetical protein
MVHIDYFVQVLLPGVNGHQFYLDLISSIGGANKETFMELVQLYLIQLQMTLLLIKLSFSILGKA